MSKDLDSAAREYLKELKAKEKGLEKGLVEVQIDVKRYEKFLGIKPIIKPNSGIMGRPKKEVKEEVDELLEDTEDQIPI